MMPGFQEQINDLTQRIEELEKLSHVPVTFIEDENGYLKVEKPLTPPAQAEE
jgi:hypothetical protein